MCRNFRIYLLTCTAISGRYRTIQEANGFVFASGFLFASFGSSSGATEELPKASRRIPEENNKKTGIGYDEIKNTLPGISINLFYRGSVRTLQFYFYSTPLLSCQQGFGQNYIFVMVSGAIKKTCLSADKDLTKKQVIK